MQSIPEGNRKRRRCMLGIIGAMDVEVAEVKEAMQGVEVKTMAGMEFYKGTLKGKRGGGSPFRNR